MPNIPDIKLDSITSIILFLIPGFVFQSVVDRYAVARKREGNEKLLGILTASAFLGAVSLPAVVLLVDVTARTELGIGLVLALLIWPAMAGFIYGRFVRGAWGEWMRRAVSANPVGSTAWLYFFGKREPVIVRAILDDGSFVAGSYFSDSCSSGPGSEDLYLERQYSTGENGSIGEMVENTRGCWIPVNRVRCLEFFDSQPKKGANDEQSRCEQGPTADDGNR